jgi:8-oxo-dGTP pyrophosphatase MutT (NUDIX family)
MQQNDKYTKGVEVTVGPLPVDNHGQVLLCRSSKMPNWCICGGHVEPGETLAEAVAREAKEEIGAEVDVLEQLCMEECFMSPPAFNRYAHFIFFTYLVKVKPGQEIKIDNDEIIDYKWMSPKDALPIVGCTYKKPLQILIDRV